MNKKKKVKTTVLTNFAQEILVENLDHHINK